MKVIYTSKALANPDGAIQSAINAFGKSKSAIQVALVAIIYMMAQHGDTRKGRVQAKTLVDGLKGLNQKAIVDFFVRQGAVVEGSDFSGWDASKLDVPTAKKTLWWELKPQNAWEGFSLEKALRTALTSSNNAMKKAEKDAELAEKVDVNPALLEGIKALLAAHSGTAH